VAMTTAKLSVLMNAPLRKLFLNRFRPLTLIVLTYPHEAVWGRCRD
jgi:hypothetical protein